MEFGSHGEVWQRQSHANSPSIEAAEISFTLIPRHDPGNYQKVAGGEGQR